MTLGGWLWAGWRFGVPAALMIVFVLVGLTSPPSSEPDAPRRPAPVLASARPLPGSAPPVAATAKAARPPALDADPGEGEGRPGEVAWPAGWPLTPPPSLPELEPVAPEVSLEPPAPAPDVHPYLRAPDEAAGNGAWPVSVVSELAAQAGDDFQGPEPGALYWFGPFGLERIGILEEARS